MEYYISNIFVECKLDIELHFYWLGVAVGFLTVFRGGILFETTFNSLFRKKEQGLSKFESFLYGSGVDDIF